MIIRDRNLDRTIAANLNRPVWSADPDPCRRNARILTELFTGKGAGDSAYLSNVEVRYYLSRVRHRLSPHRLGLRQGTKGEYRCMTCDHVLDVFDGSFEVLIRLSIPPQRALSES